MTDGDRLRRLQGLITDAGGRTSEEFAAAGPSGLDALEALGTLEMSELDAETIILLTLRPVLDIRGGTVDMTFLREREAQVWLERLTEARPRLDAAIRSVGRINLYNHALPWVGTGWVVAEGIFVTNRHVAQTFVRSVSGRLQFMNGPDGGIVPTVDFLCEHDSDKDETTALLEPIYVAENSGPDLAFFRIADALPPIRLSDRALVDMQVATIGYPASDPRIGEYPAMDRYLRGTYGVKRCAPGQVRALTDVILKHDCTTSNSGAAVVDLATGAAVGLHFAGSFLGENHALNAAVIAEVLDSVRSGRAQRRPVRSLPFETTNGGAPPEFEADSDLIQNESAVELVAGVRARNDNVCNLARALSLAAAIDVKLVRTLRRQLFAPNSVKTEVDLWASPLVARRNGPEIVLRDDVREVFWAELGDNRDELARCRGALLETRESGWPLIDLEEQLIYQGIVGDHAAIEKQLWSVVATMRSEPSRRPDLAAWCARSLPRLPAIVRDSEPGRILGSAASALVATPGKIVQTAQTPEQARLAQELSASTRRTVVSIRRVGTTLEVGRDVLPPSVQLEVPNAHPMLIVDEDTTYRLDLRGVTLIPVRRDHVMLGTSDGRRWILSPEQEQPDLDALAPIEGKSDGIAYLVGPTLAITCARNLTTDRFTLRFGADTVQAKTITVDATADIALIELATAVRAVPLELRSDIAQGDAWQAFAFPLASANVAGRLSLETTIWKGNVVSAWPRLGLSLSGAAPFFLDRPGNPIFCGKRVIGHLRGDGSPDGVFAATPARQVAWWVNRGRTAEGQAVQAIAKVDTADNVAPVERILQMAGIDILDASVGEVQLADLESAISILDEVPFPFGTARADSLVRAMGTLLRTTQDLTMLLEECGIDVGAINTNQALHPSIRDAFDVAARAGVSRKLVERLVEKFPQSPATPTFVELLNQRQRQTLLIALNVEGLEDTMTHFSHSPSITVATCRTLDDVHASTEAFAVAHAGAVRPQRPARAWIHSKRSESTPETLSVQGATDVSRADVVVVFVGAGENRRPAALYRVDEVRQGRGNATLTGTLLVRLNTPPRSLLIQHRGDIATLAETTVQRDTRNLNLHARLVDLIWTLDPDSTESERATGYLGDRRTSNRSTRTRPIIIHLPERISTSGLLGVRLARDHNLRTMRAHQWDSHMVQVIVGSEPWQPTTNAITVGISSALNDEPRSEFAAITYEHGQRDNTVFFEACNSLVPSGTWPTIVPASEHSRFDLELKVSRLSRQSPAYAYRRGVQFVVEALAVMDQPATLMSCVMHVQGCGGLDLSEAQARVRAVDEAAVLRWIDPETEHLKLAVTTEQRFTFAQVGAALGAVAEVTQLTGLDPIADRFGHASSRGGRTLTLVLNRNSATAVIDKLDDRPVRGYVQFASSLGISRVRAEAGTASLRFQRQSEDYTIGAFLEDDGVVLAGHIPARDAHRRERFRDNRP